MGARQISSSALKGQNMIAWGKASRRAPPQVNRHKETSPVKGRNKMNLRVSQAVILLMNKHFTVGSVGYMCLIDTKPLFTGFLPLYSEFCLTPPRDGCI